MSLRVAILGLCAACAMSAGAQQMAQYTHYVFNHFSVNPAVAGSKDCLDIRLGFRKQWVGFDGAPTTAWASAHGAIRAKGKPFVANHHGVGVWIEADDAGPIGYSLFYLAYAYHIQMSKDRFMSFGLFGGVKQFKLDAGDITLGTYDDPAIPGSKAVIVAPEVAPGLWIYGKTGWIGLSMHQVLGNKVKNIGLETKLTRHFQFSYGHRFKIGKGTYLTPSTLLKLSPGSPVAMDLNLMLEYKKLFSVGAGYRNADAVTLMMKVSLMKFFTLAYAYDITTSKISVASSNTHEIVLGIVPCPPNDPRKTIVRCPVFE